jgi:hypothetical protein
VATLVSYTTPSAIFLFAVSTRRYPASGRAATSKRHKIERCHVFTTLVFLRSSHAIALEKSSPMSFGGPRCTRHLVRLRSETSTSRANCDVRFRIDDRQILISASANSLQRLRTAMVFTSSHRDAIDDRFGWKLDDGAEHTDVWSAPMYEPAPREGVSGGEVEDSRRRQ